MYPDRTPVDSGLARHEIPSPCIAANENAATWSSVDQNVIDYTNKLISLNPGAFMIIIGRKVTLTNPSGVPLVKPRGPVPSDVYFYTTDS